MFKLSSTTIIEDAPCCLPSKLFVSFGILTLAPKPEINSDALATDSTIVTGKNPVAGC